jgi:signal transduction histidine kinase/DNA-binding response OmpR family regulator
MSSTIETENLAAPEHQSANEMRGLVGAFDWATTPLGPIHEWPQSLKTPVDILLTSRFAMWMGFGPALTFLYNDAYGRMTLGAKHPWALGRPAREVWVEIWRDLEPRIEQVMATGVATWDEGLRLFLQRSGYSEETYHTFSYSPLSAEDGRVAGMLCVVVEETERVIGERRLALLRDLAAGLADTVTEARVLEGSVRALEANRFDLPFALIYLFDDAYRGGGVPRLAARVGIDEHHPASAADAWPSGEILALRDSVVVEDLGRRFGSVPTGAWDDPPERAVVVPIAQQSQDSPAGYLVAGINPYRPFDNDYAGFVKLVAGQIAASLGRARAYEEERRRAEALAEIDRAKTQFFSNVSHEFRTPLTLMLGPAEEQLADPNTPPAARERVAVIHRNAVRLLKLVNTLLDFSRIEADRMTAVFEPTNLAALTTDLAGSFRSVIEAAGLRLSVDCPPLDALVAVDRDMWEKVVLNLLSNAFKHTFDGEIDVILRALPKEAQVELMVRDTGIGVPADQLPRLFERFHRVPNARSRTHEGTGIGLALVQELVKLHGGTIRVTSEEGRGTTFSVRVPVRHDASNDDARSGEHHEATRQAARAAYTSEAARWLSNAHQHDVPNGHLPSDAATSDVADASSTATILLVDDNADMREYATRLLRARGWTVATASDGGEALEIARRNPPDLVLSDVMMPTLDGFGLLRALRADERTKMTPVILLSARAGEESRVEGLDAGADDYLVKPFSAQELVARVGSHLALARARAEANVALRAAKDLLTDVLEQAPVAVSVVRGPDHVLELANPFYRELTGNRDALGKSFRDAFPEAESQGIISILDEVYRTGKPFVGQSVPVAFDRNGDGTVVPGFFNFTSHPFIVDGEVDGVITVVAEITEEVKARQIAESARKEAEAANRAKSEFLAAMSHELRTPLNAIGGYVQLLEMEIHGPITDAQRAALERVQRSEQHLLSLITDVLNFAKIEAGRIEYDLREIELAEIVGASVALVEPQLTARGLRGLFSVPPGVVVMADGEKLRQILLNLLSNAAKFSRTGGSVIIEVEPPSVSGDAGNFVRLNVTDTGVGIPQSKHEAIFDPFVQVHRDLRNPTEGTGLGLAISRDLARGMGGDLRVRSVEGAGSTFTLSLRRVEPASSG